MYLKRIEMFGFKSFASSTRLEFNRGITAIVGPNGCGKSNAADALRWVLGIQGAKVLRGKRMEDIIFNGTKVHKPLGMCEVSIMLGSDDGELLDTPFGSFGEIVATRRLHRSGDSEFFLNNIPCRLRDLTDVFLDIGIGSGYLEVIEQGRLSKVIDVSPQERRVVLEEAAGILKYKERRNEALRKLETSEQNLARVGDIIGELERQVRSLRRQALKAERYRRHRETLRGLEVAILAADHRKFQARLATLEERRRHAAADEAAVGAQVTTLDNEISLCRAAQMDAERALQACRTRQLQVEHEVDKHKSMVSHLTDRLDGLERETERCSRDVAQWSDELASIERTVEELRTESRECEAALEAQTQVVEECRARLSAATQQLTDGDGVLRERKGALIGVLSDIATCRNALTAAQARMEQAWRSLQRVEAERVEEEKSREASASRLQQTSLALEGHREALALLAGGREQAQARMKECLAELDRAEQARSNLQETLAEKMSLLNSLEKVQRDLVGVQEGPRAVLKGREGEGPLRGIRGLVADALETDAEYEAAIEAVLGGRLQALIVESPADGLAVVRFLQERGLGRAECVPLEPKRPFRNPPPINGTPGIVAQATDVVRCSQPYQQVMEFLLSDVFIVEDAAAARSVLEVDGVGECTMVTLDGTVIEAYGGVSGGSEGDHGMLKTKRTIGLLRREQSALKEELQGRTAEVASLTERRRECEQQLEAMAEEGHALEKAIVQSESELCHLRESLARTESKQLALDLDEAALRHELEGLQDEAAQHERQLAVHAGHQEEVEREIQRLQATLESQAGSINALKDEINKHEIELARLRATQDRVAREMGRLEHDESETRRRIAARRNEREEVARTTAGLRGQVEEAGTSIAALSEERQGIAAEATGKEKELRQHESTGVERESVARTLRSRLKELQEHLQGLLVERTELVVQMEHLERVAQESHEVSLGDVLAEPAAQGVDTDALREEARSVRSKLESLGNVNLAAQEEYDEVNERYTFLLGQRDDLTTSIASLRQAIAQINRTTTKRFAETFHAVNENFQESCARIFGGGEASLILTDPDDLLETGVDISVQPPGKQVRNISLLSVGEKVLASAALLFAVFRVKPSPFYFIDEMDAPLDEANAKRFVELIEELAGDSQFILVTHNKATMAAAETLYGITMEEDGVSKLISLHFNERGEDSAAPARAEYSAAAENVPAQA